MNDARKKTGFSTRNTLGIIRVLLLLFGIDSEAAKFKKA